MNSKPVSIALGSLIGTAVLHAILTACSGSAAGTPDARAHDAARMPDSHVADPPAPCTSWQIAAYYTSSFITGTRPPPGGLDVTFPEGLTSEVQLPAGWEPLTASVFGGAGSNSTTVTLGALTMLRKCMQ
jgi:hypothetical protein